MGSSNDIDDVSASQQQHTDIDDRILIEKLLLNSSDFQNVTDIELVRPVKINPESLHEEDLLYESKDGLHNKGESE